MKITQKWSRVDRYATLTLDSAKLRHLAKHEKARITQLLAAWLRRLEGVLTDIAMGRGSEWCQTTMEIRDGEICLVTRCYDEMGMLISETSICDRLPRRIEIPRFRARHVRPTFDPVPWF